MRAGRAARRLGLIGGLLLCSVALLPAATSSGQSFLDVELFARVPHPPGLPEGIAVSAVGEVYVTTGPKDALGTDGKPPSKVFVYGPEGDLRREFVIEDQDRLDPFYGLVGAAFDGRDRLYTADVAPPRIVRLDPSTGEQVDYATFADVPNCVPPVLVTNCSDTLLDRPAIPDYPVFAADGTMYVTDLNQALIWRVPPGGGSAEVWYTNRGLETIFGPNGIGFMPDGQTLLFAKTFEDAPGPPDFPAGLYTLPVNPDGTPGLLGLFWATVSDDAPDGFAIAQSGNIYLALAGPFNPGLVVISPAGQTLARVPAIPAENQQLEVPFDAPASVAFLGDSALVTNHANFSRNPNSYAVLDVQAGEPGLPLFRPFGVASPARSAEAKSSCRGIPATLTGTSAADRQAGTPGDDVIASAGGRDRISGGGGDDLICAGQGRDRIAGGPGRDRLLGEGGRDRLGGGTGVDLCRGGPGRDRVKGCERGSR